MRKDPAPTSFKVVARGCIAAFGAEEYNEHQTDINRLIEVQLGLKPRPLSASVATKQLSSVATASTPTPASKPESHESGSAEKTNETNLAVISYTKATPTLPKLTPTKSAKRHIPAAANDAGGRSTSPTPVLSGSMVADVQHCGWLDVSFNGERRTLFVVLVHSGYVSFHLSEDIDDQETKPMSDLTITGSSRIQLSETVFLLVTEMSTVIFSIPEKYQSTCNVQQELARWTQEFAISIFFRRDEMKKKRKKRRSSFTAAERAAVELLQDDEDDKGKGKGNYMDDDVVDLGKFIKERNEWVAQQEKQFIESSSMVSNKRAYAKKRRDNLGSLKLLLTEAGLKGATYKGDYLNFRQKLGKLKSHFVAAGGSSMEKLLFSSVAARVYQNNFHFVRSPRQRRVLVLTTRALYEMNSVGKLTSFRRRIKISEIVGATVSNDLTDVVALRLPTDYDILYTCQRRTELVSWLMLAKSNELYALVDSDLQINFESPIRLKVKGGALMRTQFDERLGRITMVPC